MSKNIFTGVLVAAVVAVGSPSFAQDWPTRPIKWIVPYQPASGPDITVRIVADAMGQVLKQPVVIENKPGAAGSIAAAVVAHSPADGYTWLYSASPMAGNTKMYKSTGYDLYKDFTHVSLMTTSDTLLAVNAKSKYKTLQDLLADAGQNPGKLSYGSGGVGTPSHLGVELLLNAAGVNVAHIPYRGAAASVVAMLGNEIDFSLPVFGVALPDVQAGKLRALAVGGKKRNPKLPDVPTLAESGFPNVAIESFGGLSVPAGTPAPVVARIRDALQKVLARPDVKTKLGERGALFVGTSTSEQYVAMLTEEIKNTERMMQAAKLEAQ